MTREFSEELYQHFYRQLKSWRTEDLLKRLKRILPTEEFEKLSKQTPEEIVQFYATYLAKL